MYECGTCGNNTLIATALVDGKWQLACGRRHLWITTTGTEIQMDTAVVVADLTPLVT